MLATSGPVPVSSGWAFEVKFDGVRAIGYAARDGLRLYSRNDRDISCSHPEVAALQLGKGVIVDGELVALDRHARDPHQSAQRSPGGRHRGQPAPSAWCRCRLRDVGGRGDPPALRFTTGDEDQDGGAVGETCHGCIGLTLPDAMPDQDRHVIGDTELVDLVEGRGVRGAARRRPSCGRRQCPVGDACAFP